MEEEEEEKRSVSFLQIKNNNARCEMCSVERQKEGGSCVENLRITCMDV